MSDLIDRRQWIPCSERLPEDGTEVFVHLYHNPEIPYIAWIKDSRWHTEEFEVDREDEPLAWMPLPEPYREGEQKSDYISRQAAIDAINHICPVDTDYDSILLDRVDVRYALSDLPSAELEKRISLISKTYSDGFNDGYHQGANMKWEEEDNYNDYPVVTIVRDRYTGAYSGGKWLAYPVEPWSIPRVIYEDDVSCANYWSFCIDEDRAKVGIGDTIREAIFNLGSRADMKGEENE